MEYVIANPSRKIYIKLDKNGNPVTCNVNMAQRFTESKANNIVRCLPKTMQKFNFGIKEIKEDGENTCKTDEVHKDIIVNKDYKVSDAVLSWLDKSETCKSLAAEANKRKEELTFLLSNIDKTLSNCLHEIELESWKNGCEGYKEYKSIKLVLEERRIIKDELSVVQSILSSNMENIMKNCIEKMIKRLANRKFNIREVESYDFL